MIEGGRVVIACMVRNCFEEAYSKVHLTGLYTRFGFEYVETVEAFYPDIGCKQRFMMFEKTIDGTT